MRRTVVLLAVACLACETANDDRAATDTPDTASARAADLAPDTMPPPTGGTSGETGVPVDPEARREVLEALAPDPVRSRLVLDESGTPSISGTLNGVSLGLQHIDGDWRLSRVDGTVDGVTLPDSTYLVTPVVVDLGDSLYVGYFVTDRVTSEVVAARRTTVRRGAPEQGER